MAELAVREHEERREEERLSAALDGLRRRGGE
jgi:hypothetical protein